MFISRPKTLVEYYPNLDFTFIILHFIFPFVLLIKSQIKPLS